mmetsp:Transcript_32802/g.44967  ORF Transcript_32802/g.44967 Transcript_32802/m.44967 type:complete len:85 (-) Transcript_32802:35-289(-)
MTSYSELVNIEVGNAANYGSHFNLSCSQRFDAINFLISNLGKRPKSQLMRVYIAGSMESGNTHLGNFSTAVSALRLVEKGWLNT